MGLVFALVAVNDGFFSMGILDMRKHIRNSGRLIHHYDFVLIILASLAIHMS